MSQALTLIDRMIALTHEYGLAKGAFAQDARGNRVSSNSENACSLCAMGFAVRAERQLGYTDEEYRPVRTAIGKVFEDRGYTAAASLPQFNDAPETTIEDLRQLFLDARKKLA